MKTVLSHPTALKGLLLLALVANISYGTSTFTANEISETTLSSMDRVPADAPAIGVGTSSPTVGAGTSAPVLTAAQLKLQAAKRSVVDKGRDSKGSTHPDDLASIPAPPAPGATSTTGAPPAAPVTAPSKPAAVPDVRSATAPSITTAAPAANAKLSSTAVCDGDCQRLAMQKTMDQLKGFLASLNEAQKKLWLQCSNGDKDACIAYADSRADKDGKAKPDADGPAAPIEDMKALTDEFAEKMIASHRLSMPKEEKDRNEARLSELYDKLNGIVRDLYDSGDASQRAKADATIARMISSMAGASVSADFKLRSKVVALREIKDGYKLRELSDKFADRVDSISADLRADQMTMQLAQQSNDGYAYNQARIEYMNKLNDAAALNREFMTATIRPMSQLSAYRSDIPQADYASYTASYIQTQKQIQQLGQSSSTTNTIGNTSIFGGQSSGTPVFGNGTINQGQFGQNGFNTGMNTSMPPYTGAINTGFNNGSSSSVFGAPNFGSSQFGSTNFGTQTFGTQNFGNQGFINPTQNSAGVLIGRPFSASPYGGCQSTPIVYNQYMPAQPTCLSSSNSMLTNQNVFASRSTF